MKKKTHLELRNGSAACGALATSRYLTKTPKSVDCPSCKAKMEKKEG